MTTQQASLTQRLVAAMEAASHHMAHATSEQQSAAREVEADAARTVLGGQLRHFADAVASACARAGHRRPGRVGSQPTPEPCSNCSRKMKHFREAATIIEPDRA